MKSYRNSKFEITVLAPCIFRLAPYDGIDLEVEDVLEMRKVYLEFSGGKKFAILLDATWPFNPTPEARKLLASREYTELRFAAALVTRSLPNKLVGNFFIKFNRPATPTKMFSDEATALKWLLEQQKNKD